MIIIDFYSLTFILLLLRSFGDIRLCCSYNIYSHSATRFVYILQQEATQSNKQLKINSTFPAMSTLGGYKYRKAIT